MKTDRLGTLTTTEPTQPISRTPVDTRAVPAPTVPVPTVQRGRHWPTVAALVASVALGAAGVLAFTAGASGGRASGGSASSSVAATTVAAPAPVAPVAPTDVDDETSTDVPSDGTVPEVTVLPLPTVPPAVTAPPPVAPPAGPAPMLSVPVSYELDPGVHDVTVTLANEGDASLHFELLNHGDGYSAQHSSGEIAPGDSLDVFVELDVVADGDGPTLFERAIEIASTGGDATVTVSGQVEKPGHLVAEFDTVPIVDFRAAVHFTNVGELPLEITGVTAPGLTLSPLPDTIAGGDTLVIEVAICGSGSGLPVKYATPQLPWPLWTYGSFVTLVTDANGASTGVHGASLGFFAPSCTPVIVPPVADLVLGG